MAAIQNKHTNAIRSRVSSWISSKAGGCFTLATLCYELESFLSDFSGVDTAKAVSNELLRQTTKGQLTYTTLPRLSGESGRPPRLYRQKWVKQLLTTLEG